MILDPRHPTHRRLRHRNLCTFSAESSTLVSGPLEHPASEPCKMGDAHYPEPKVPRKGRTTTSSLSEPPFPHAEGTGRAELPHLALEGVISVSSGPSCRPSQNASSSSHRALRLSSKFLFKGLFLIEPPSQTLYLK